MKSVPPLASSNFPLRCLTAEVKAPRSWPKSSLSISSEGMAAQFTSTKGAAARRLRAWSQRATSSLPVPFSPVTSTRASQGATFSISSRTRRICDDCPMISGCAVCARRARAAVRAGAAAGLSVAGALPAASGSATVRRMDSSRRFMSMGLVTKSRAPLRTALTAESMEASPERAMKGMPASGTRQPVSERMTSKGIRSQRREAAASSSTASAE